MVKEGYAFSDRLSGEAVHYFRDRLRGKLWLATGAWSGLRVWVPYRHTVLADALSTAVAERMACK